MACVTAFNLRNLCGPRFSFVRSAFHVSLSKLLARRVALSPGCHLKSRIFLVSSFFTIMAFPFSTVTHTGHWHCVVLPKPLLLLARSIDRAWFAVSGALERLGLVSSPETLLAFSWDQVYAHSSAPDFQAQTVRSAIKARLPIIEFSSFQKKCDVTGEVDFLCAVCLEKLKAGDEVRELGNCSHAFHKDCLDEWVESGHISCPLCRAEVMPLKNSLSWYEGVSNKLHKMLRG